jgi:hypothetical protein
MKKQEVEVSKAICQVCKWQNQETTKVKPKVSFGGTLTNGKEYVGNIIFNYWTCPKHGSVGALIGKRIVDKPLDLFKGKIAIYEAEETVSAYPTTAEEFAHSLFADKYKTKKQVER